MIGMDYYYPINQAVVDNNNYFIIDFKQGDVNGDRIIDMVYLFGKRPFGEESLFINEITLLVSCGCGAMNINIPLKYNAGYNPTLFLGDFTGDGMDDILISIDSGGSGDFGLFYLYSLKNNVLKQLFDFINYNEEYKFDVIYKDDFRVDVISNNLSTIFTVDIRSKNNEYLSDIYDDKGKLKVPIKGQVVNLGELYPIDIERDGIFELLAVQRIIGTANADTLGYVQTYLKWDGLQFIPIMMEIADIGRQL